MKKLMITCERKKKNKWTFTNKISGRVVKSLSDEAATRTIENLDRIGYKLTKYQGVIPPKSASDIGYRYLELTKKVDK